MRRKFDIQYDGGNYVPIDTGAGGGIAEVSGQYGNAINSGYNTDYTFPSDVSTGSLIVICIARTATTGQVPVNADITFSGTAVMASTNPSTDQTHWHTASIGGVEYTLGVFSALVTTGGTLTVNNNDPDSVYVTTMHCNEYSGNWDGTRTEDSATGNDTGADDVPVDTADVTSVGAALFVGLCYHSEGGYTGFPAAAEWTEKGTRWNGDALRSRYIHQIVSTGTTDKPEWNPTSPSNFYSWNAIGVVYKEA